MNKIDEIKKQLVWKVKDSSNTNTIFDTRKYLLYDDVIKIINKALIIDGVSIAERKLAIKFADALLMDFEMSEFENDDLCWKLRGTPNKTTTEVAFDTYIKEILAN